MNHVYLIILEKIKIYWFSSLKCFTSLCHYHIFRKRNLLNKMDETRMKLLKFHFRQESKALSTYGLTSRCKFAVLKLLEKFGMLS